MTDLSSIEQFLPLLLLCCMIPLMTRGGQSSGATTTTEMDVWFTSFTAQEAYDTVTKETDELREKVEIEDSTKKSKLSFLSLRRGSKQRYVVDQTIPPNIYRILDKEAGPMYFEISYAEDGGTQVKATFSPRNKAAVQSIKTRMPSRKLMAAGKEILPKTICPSCGKPRIPEWQLCPYCGSKFS